MSDAPQGNSVLAFLASEFGAQELPTLSYLATMLTQEEEQERETTKPTAVVHTEDAATAATTSTKETETPEVAEQQQQHCEDTPQDEAVERRSVPLPLIPGTSMLDFVIRNLCQDKHAFPCLHLLQEQLQHDDNNNKKEEEAAKKVNVPAESMGSHAVTLSTEADKDLTEDMIMIGEGAATVLQQREDLVKEKEKDNQQVVVAAMTSEALTSPSSVQHTEPDKVEEEAPRAPQRKVSDIPVIVGVTESTQPHKTKRTAPQIVTEVKPKASNTSKVEEGGNARWQAGRRPRRISETLLTQLRQQLHARRSSQPTAVAGSPHVIQQQQAEEAHKAEDASEVVARVRRGFVERYLDNLYGRKRNTPLAKPSPHSRRFPLHNNNSPVGGAKKPREADGNAVVEDREENEHQPLLPGPHSARHNNNNNAVGEHHNELEQRVTTPHAQQRLETHALEEKANVLSSQIATPRQLAQRHVTSEFFQDYRVPLHTPRTPSQPLSRREPRRPSRLTGVHDVLATPNSQPYGSRRNSHSIRLHDDNPPPTGNAAANRVKSPIAPIPVQRRRSSANGRQQGRPPSALRVQQQQQQQPLGVRNSLDLVVVGKTVKMAQSQPHRPSSAIRR